jgi:hypothetical protein
MGKIVKLQSQKTTDEKWKSTSATILKLSKLPDSGAYGWDATIAWEFCRTMMGKCDPEKAEVAASALYAQYECMPRASEIVRKANERPANEHRWITVERQHMSGRTYTYARSIPFGADAEAYVYAGERLVDEGVRDEELVRASSCDQGLEFQRVFREFRSRMAKQ